MNMPLKYRVRTVPPRAGGTTSDGPLTGGVPIDAPGAHGSQAAGKKTLMSGVFATAKSHERSSPCVWQ